MPRSVLIPKTLARRQLFRALPAEYPANAEVEARECASQAICTMNSRPLRIVARNSSWGRVASLLCVSSSSGLPPEE